MAAQLSTRSHMQAGRVTRPSLPALPARVSRPALQRQQGLQGLKQATPSHVARAAADDQTVDVDAIVKDLQQKWDGVENKTSVLVYAGGAVVALWLSSTIVSAVNVLPIVPKLLELVGLGYTAWFVYRYLLFKSSREELITDVEDLKKKIAGVADETAGKAKRSTGNY